MSFPLDDRQPSSTPHRLTRRAAILSGATFATSGGLVAALNGPGRSFAAAPSGPAPSNHPTHQDAATPEALPPPSAGSRTATLAEELRNPRFDDGHVRYAIEVLARSGIATFPDATGGEPLREPRTPLSPMRLTHWQVRNLALEMATGAGRLGANLDQAFPVPAEAPPVSYLLAGYIGGADTLGASFCRGLLTDQDLTRPTEVVFPSIVFVLFASDLALDTSPPAAVDQSNARRAVLPATQGICSDIQNFIDQTLAAVFDSLKVTVPDNLPGAILASTWNLAVAIAEGVITGLANVLIGPVIQVIRAIAGAVALVSHVLSAVIPWYVNANPSFGQTRFAVGDEPDIAGSITFTIDTGGLDNWPADIADCAAVAGAPLPPLAPEPGTPIALQLVESPIDLVNEGETPTILNEDSKAILSYVTNREPSDDGPVRSGTFLVSFSMERSGLEGLGQVLAGVLTAALPPVVTEPLIQLLGGQIDSIDSALDTLSDVAGTSLITVIYHDAPEPTPESASASTTESASSSPSSCPDGSWRSLNAESYLASLLDQSDIAITSFEGAFYLDLMADGAFTLEPALLFSTESEFGGDVGNGDYTVGGVATGTWTVENGAIVFAYDASGLEVAIEAFINGVSLGSLVIGIGDLGPVTGVISMSFTCTQDGFLLHVPGAPTPIAFVP